MKWKKHTYTITFGNYDTIVSIETETMTQLNNIILTKIRKVGTICSTTTLRVTD